MWRLPILLSAAPLTCPKARPRTAFTAVTHTVPSWLSVSTQGTVGRVMRWVWVYFHCQSQPWGK